MDRNPQHSAPARTSHSPRKAALPARPGDAPAQGPPKPAGNTDMPTGILLAHLLGLPPRTLPERRNDPSGVVLLLQADPAPQPITPDPIPVLQDARRFPTVGLLEMD